MEILSEYMQPNKKDIVVGIEHDEMKNLWEVKFQDESVGFYKTQAEAAARADYFRQNNNE
tara:strand:+ start:54 stop:233 length:180 start_codon:yes stop_codon:yes gene_type:complete